MNCQEFDTVVAKVLSECLEVLKAREADYSVGGDRLANFKEAAQLLDCEPEQALFGFAAKHITALAEYIRKLPEDVGRERWLEKTTDIHNYLFLLRALLEERWRK